MFQWAIFLLAGGLGYNVTKFDPNYTSPPDGSLGVNAVVCGLYVIAFAMVPGNIAQYVVQDRTDGSSEYTI